MAGAGSKATSVAKATEVENNELELREKALAEKEAELQKKLAEAEKLIEEANSNAKANEEKAKAPSKRRNIDRNEMVKVRNISSGSLVYKSQKTGLTTVWEEYGSEEYLEFGEILTMKASQPRFLNKPWILIEDKDVVEYLGLKKIYDNLIPIDELDAFFYLQPSEIAEKLDVVPQGVKDLVASKARKMIEAGQLYDMRIIKILEEKINVDLSIFAK